MLPDRIVDFDLDAVAPLERGPDVGRLAPRVDLGRRHVGMPEEVAYVDEWHSRLQEVDRL